MKKSPTDRKTQIEYTATQAEKLTASKDEMAQAWMRLTRELVNMTHPEARSPRFSALLNAIWIAATNDQT